MKEEDPGTLMFCSNRSIALIVLFLAASGMVAAENHVPNPYKTVAGWAKLEQGRVWGALSAIYPARDGKHIWIAERCGANSCVDSDLDPIMLLDETGNVVKSFGAGLFAWPHGMHVDADGNIWVSDAVGYAAVPAGMGHVVYKFSPQGELLLTLGTKGKAGSGKTSFRKPSDMLVAPNGDIFVVDGHAAPPGEPVNNRVVKFSSDGTYLKEWGSTGSADGEFKDPHALAMDSHGRLFVGDRGNSRIQIFDQDGNHLATWPQFGRPSGLFIDDDDNLYCTDSESNAQRNPGFTRGIRIGSVTDGIVSAFIPDPGLDQGNSGSRAAEGVAVDAAGNVYGAQVSTRGLQKYVLK